MTQQYEAIDAYDTMAIIENIDSGQREEYDAALLHLRSVVAQAQQDRP